MTSAADEVLRILVVDDDELAVEMIATGLGESGHAVETALEGAQALSRVRAGGIDLVISDWIMPGMDGVELCRAIRRGSGPYVYFMLVTARDGIEDVVQGLEAGADDFIPKPFDPVELEARVRTIRRLKLLHQRVEQQNAELRRTQELKDDWTKMLVHDLRAPLMSVVGYCELAAMKAGAVVEREMGIVRSEAARLNEMLEQMLLMAKSEAGRLRPSCVELDLEELAGRAIEGMQAVARAREVSLRLEVAAAPVGLSADPSLLRRLVDNLLSNAVKFSPRGGTVHLELGREEDAVLIAVSDEGPGVPAGAESRLFEKYDVSEMRKLGVPQHGLGLAFCRLVTTAHGGSIAYSRGPEGGSRFEARLPAAVVVDEPVAVA